jgi:hypothetical protein
VKGSRHIEFCRYLPDGTSVPKADSSDSRNRHDTRTIGPESGIRETQRVSLCADDEVNLKQESPGRDLHYET